MYYYASVRYTINTTPDDVSGGSSEVTILTSAEIIRTIVTCTVNIFVVNIESLFWAMYHKHMYVELAGVPGSRQAEKHVQFCSVAGDIHFPLVVLFRLGKNL